MGCCGDDTSYDPEYEMKKRGLKRSRQCTDVFCFLIFILFLVGMGGIAFLTIVSDNRLQRMLNGFDSYMNTCGMKNEQQQNVTQFSGQDTSGLNHVLFFDYEQPVDSAKACVRECPDEEISTRVEFVKYTLTRNVSLCFYSVPLGVYDERLCPTLPIFRTKSVANRCVPNVQDMIEHHLNSTVINKFVNVDMYKVAVARLLEQMPQIGVMTIAALLVTILLVCLLRYIAGIMVYAILLLSAGGAVGASAFLWHKYSLLIRTDTIVMYTFPLIGIECPMRTAYLLYAIACTVFTVVLLMLIWVMRKRVGLVIRLIAEAQMAIIDMPLIFVLPVVTFSLLIVFLTYWLAVAFGVNQYGDESGPVQVYLPKIPVLGLNDDSQVFAELSRRNVTTVMWIYHVIALIWITEFLFACQSMVITSSVAKWYFTRDKYAFSSPIFLSIRRLAVFHLGSMAFGSFLITLIRFPRWCLMFLQDKIKASRSEIAEFFSKLCICCLYCLEKFILYINSNAYTIIAIEGIPFCAAAQKAFIIIMENALRVAAINSVGDFLLFLSKLLVSAITAVLAYFYLGIDINFSDSDAEQLTFKLAPVALVMIIAYLIAHTFFTIYEMVIDSLLVCFCEDCRANDGSPERPYYMSSSLKGFVDESSTQITINN